MFVLFIDDILGFWIKSYGRRTRGVGVRTAFERAVRGKKMCIFASVRKKTKLFYQHNNINIFVVFFSKTPVDVPEFILRAGDRLLQ